MFLIDTNIWLERLLNQERSLEVAEFFSVIPSNYLFITDFSFHSIGVIAHRLNKIEIFCTFVHDTFIEGSVGLLTLLPSHMENLLSNMGLCNPDFDDGYQLSVMKDHDLSLVREDRLHRNKAYDQAPGVEEVPDDLLLKCRDVRRL